ncbi:MAG: hypothetical protein KDB79_09585 [Acidobacteria bacterium]|nr:hypothetical protein [Acidobacteriota bacterium]
MNLKQTKLHILHEAKSLSAQAKTGVSLHCHTEYSKEMLDFVPHYAKKLPIIAFFWRREQKKYLEREGRSVDFSTAYWSPPMSPSAVYDIEKNQIEEAGLKAIVSLTDHDSIDGTKSINENTEHPAAPISLEWTVPYEYGFFHLGVHNLPESRADEITRDLLAYTFSEDEVPDRQALHGLFAMLNEMPEVLIIFNHPLWDIEIVGQERHEILLKNFLKEYGKWIHALEINGFRAWSENKAVIEMAEALGFPVATGGDRHGCKPNTVINITNSDSFSEFVEEIRVDKRSEVVLMPEYEQPLHSRQLQSFSEILTHYPDFPEHRQKWFDRIFYDMGNGKGLVPLSEHGWVHGGPLWLQWAVWTLGVMGSPRFRPVFSLFRKAKDRVPHDLDTAEFTTPDMQDIASILASERQPIETEFAS